MKMDALIISFLSSFLLPAPGTIFEFVSCKCKKGCQTKRCSCFTCIENLMCTELCHAEIVRTLR